MISRTFKTIVWILALLAATSLYWWPQRLAVVSALDGPGLQAQINAACSGGVGGSVYIGSGSVPLTAGIVFTAANSNCTVYGAGMSQTVLRVADNVNQDAVKCSGGASNIQLMDFTIEGDGANQTNGRGVYATNCTNIRAFRVRTHNTREHGWFMDDGVVTFRCFACEADGETNGSGFLIGNTPLNARVDDVQLIGGRADNSANANGVFCTGSKVGAAFGNDGFQVVGMSFSGNADTGIEFGASCQNGVVSSNRVSISAAGTTGIMVRSSGPVQVTGNEILCNGSSTQKAIFVWNNGGADNTNTRGVNVGQNVVRGCTGASSNGIELNSGDDITLASNMVDTSPIVVSSSVTNFRRGGNSDWLWASTVSKPMFVDSASVVAGTSLALLQFQAVQGGPAGFRIRENAVALPNGLWRIQSSGDVLTLNKNTAAGGDFSTNFDALTIGTGTSGTVTIPQGQLQANQGLRVGGASGGTIAGIFTGTATLTFTSIAAQTCQEQTLTITGASVTNMGTFAAPRATLGNVNLSWSAWVSAGNTESVRVCNPTVAAITPNAVAWGGTVLQ